MKPIVLILLFAAGGALAQQPTPSPAPRAELDQAKAARDAVLSYLKLARKAVANHNLSLAEGFFERMLNVPAPDSDKRDGLLIMAQAYEEACVYTKAIAVYEKFVHLFPRDNEAPAILLKLGRLYRETGAYQLALDRFYNVLNIVLKISSSEVSPYKNATLTAQFEIAETYFTTGDYQQANKFFNLIKLLDLTPEDRERANFRSLYCLFLLNQYDDVINAAKQFIEQYSSSPNLPEVRYITASSLKAANRPQEALTYTLDLLRNGKANAAKDPESWIFWKRKTGNQIANDFYKDGDFLKALTIYQSLATLSEAPDWQWPVVYQMGICFERLRLPNRAIEAYQFIIQEYKKNQDAATLPENVTACNQMAQWRINYLKWQEKTEMQMASLLTPPDVADLKIPSITALPEAKPAAISASTPSASGTPIPAATPIPSATPALTIPPTPPVPAPPQATAVPAVSPAPAATPAPSATPTPVPTPEPSAAPSPAVTPEPASTPDAKPGGGEPFLSSTLVISDALKLPIQPSMGTLETSIVAPSPSPKPKARRKPTPRPSATPAPTPQSTPSRSWISRIF